MAADPRTSERVAGCGWFTRSGMVEIRSIGSSVYPAQLIVCGRVWQEAVCSAKIRARKAVELENLIEVHGRAGGGITLGTFTAGEHHLDDSLESSLGILRASWDRMVNRSKRYKVIKERYGFMGLVLAYEFTYGESGWHPHLHALWFHEEPLPAQGLYEVNDLFAGQWKIGIEAAGRYLHPVHGVKVDMNAVGTALGGYVAKVQEGDWTAAQELTKGDVKTARSTKGRTPFTILREHYQTGDVADWKLWQEFSAGVLLGGNRSIPVCRMSPGLRKKIHGSETAPQMTDEQLAAVEVGGVLIAVLSWKVWLKVRNAGLGPALLSAGEARGLDGINAVLTEHGLGQAEEPPAMREAA
jgi:hypothetical protein